MTLDTFAKPKLPPLHHTLLGVAAHLVPIRPGTVAAAVRGAAGRRPSGFAAL
ncbi:MAG TPA: hypothetical protein VKV32_14555 [Stellaceae bacterium]|nr:hypothetical protein [Stellaceae bacterium]